MSSETLVEGPDGILAAWETSGQVYWGKVDAGSGRVPQPVAAPGAGGGRKHPALAVNARGEILLAWAEGTGWQRGGTLAWQLFDRSGSPMGERGRLPGGIPVWGLPTSVARPDGGFTILH
jgi:hypothetical protein